MEQPYYYQYSVRYSKALARLQKNLLSGRFATFTQQKKQQVWNRLCRYARQFGVKVKAPLAAACLAAGLCFANSATSQTFVIKSGGANPLASFTFANLPSPTFADIDKDGDQDAFVGDYSGLIRYFKNTGSALAPVFEEQIGDANPLNAVDAGEFSFIKMADIDNDGDLDAFISSLNGTIRYLKNEGSLLAPLFTEQTGLGNPLSTVNTGWIMRPSFIDINGDGKLDVFFGKSGGGILYYKNTGTLLAPAFTDETGPNNPLNFFDSYEYGLFNATFSDLDHDGDYDVLITQIAGDLLYYKNTGNILAPVFTPQFGLNNPFIDMSDQEWPAPAFADLNGDGDQDVFFGTLYGGIQYYENTELALPLHLVAFSGSSLAGNNQLVWQTTDELNTKSFEVEMSSDGRNFSRIATLNAKGTGNNKYSITDNATHNGKVFYRLKMVDADGRVTYSNVIFISGKLLAGISVYPNPVVDMLNINIGSANILKTRAGVYDVNGSLVQSFLITGNQLQINVRPLAKGNYVIKFADGNTFSFLKK